MKEKSTYSKLFRELMCGGNQQGMNMEWALELLTEMSR
ncbi:hypothetical protein BCE_3377 [Bacillus cereus ATCC 10987]|uniref:Uncharacterized protein n=1 Tax=Bacillus cereus (strain ATCC 10987 / NRS 248) TaxID=222523 RepID=Q734M7_BACC1|nr:hypothetical protein BCE_3377 [Bacillus cereus ATCC 10987]